MALATNRYFLLLTRALVVRHDQTERPLQLFERVGIPKSPGYRALAFYETHGAVRVANGISSDARRVVALQGGLRAERALPDRVCRSGPDLVEALAVLEKNGIACAIGFQTAANVQAYYEPTGAHALYIHPPTRPQAQAARLVEVCDRLSASPQATDTNRYELYLDDLARLDIEQGPRGPMTSPVQTLLDLAIHNRTAAHRDFLFDRLLTAQVIHD